MEVPASHLIQSEINAVTSAIRKHVRNASSSSFLGGSSSAVGVGPIAGGSSAASLLRNAVASASTPARNGIANGHTPTSSISALPAALRVASGGKVKEDATAFSRQLASSSKLSHSRQAYPDGRRDEGVSSLLHAFSVLRAQLREVQDLEQLPITQLLSPFLRVILSPRTTGPVTSIALQAVHRLLIYNIVKIPSDSYEDSNGIDSVDTDPNAVQLAIADIAHAVSHCRFEASDASADELVLLRILAVMRELICADGRIESSNGTRNSSGRTSAVLADCLGDESICEMMETGLSMCCQMRLSELLRRTAEQSMTTMIRALFIRLQSISTTADETFSSDPDLPEVVPEHATLSADLVGKDALEAERDKKLRRMTMPDPQSRDIPAAAAITSAALQELKEIGEKEEAEEHMEELTDEGTAVINDGEEEGLKSAGEAISAGQDTDSSFSREEVPKPFTQDQSPTTNTATAPYRPAEMKPFGLPAIKEVLRVIVSLLDPHNTNHTDAMRLLGLSILSSVFEVAGRSIGRFPSLRAIIQDSACKYLFQLVRSDNSTILTYSLRTFSTLFETMKVHLKLQHEMFLLFLLDRLSPTFPLALEPWKDEAANTLAIRRANLSDSRNLRRAGTPDLSNGPPQPPPPPPMPKSSDRAPAHGETREMMLETFNILLGAYQSDQVEIDTLLELWVNYDCDIDCENLFEKVIHFLCRAVYATNPLHPDVLESSQLFAVDVLLNFLANMTARQEAEAMGAQVEIDWPDGLPSADSLSKQKSQKASILAGAARFNAKPKDGLAYLEQQGFIDTTGKNGVSRAVSIAKFLKDCPRLDKKLLGDYISRPDNIDILEAFLRLFDFSNKPIADAMREMLEAFRLPGESQQIARITETFAKIYFASEPAEIKSEDAVYVLSYSVIMLNTDLHNPQNKRRMSVEDYRRNLRGVNDNADFDEDYLGSIYDSIRRREIVMPEEHVGQLGFEYTWKELLRRSRNAGNLLSTTTTKFDQAMFETSWRPIMASIAHAFRTHKDEHILEREISGFRHCAILASRYGMIELFDSMCQGLANATGLLDVSGAGVMTSNAHVEVEGQKITVSPLSIQFGGNFKGQLAAVVLFTIANGNGNAIRKGWLPIFEIFKNLFINSLLPPSIIRMYEFGQEKSRALPLKARKLPGPSLQDPRTQAGSGLLSTISSYLLSPYSGEKEAATPDVNDQDVESSLCTVDCVASCRTEELFAQILELRTEALIPALTTLVELANRYTIEKRMAMSTEGESSSGRSTPVQSSGNNANSNTRLMAQQQLPYDASAAFVLEMATTIACSADPDSIPEAWSLLYEHLQVILSTSLHYNSLQIQRTTVSILRLIDAAAAVPYLRDQIFIALDQLASLPSEYKPVLASQIVAGLHQILRNHRTLVQSQTEWSLILSLFQMYSNVRNAFAANQGFEAIAFIAREQMSEDNFIAMVGILREFGKAADTIEATSNGTHQAASVRRTLTEKKELKEYEEACQQRGPASLELLDSLKIQIIKLSSKNNLTLQDAWNQYWKPLMTAIAAQYINAHRGTRQAAITYLQRILLTPELQALYKVDDDGKGNKMDRFVVDDLFYSVLFPTLHKLLKPEVFQRDSSNESGSMQETRIRACNLLCKVFLHYLGQMISSSSEEVQGLKAREVDEAFVKLWLIVLDFFDRFMHSGKRDQLVEATPENLKNVLLVMHASGLLIPPPSSSTPSSTTTTTTEKVDDEGKVKDLSDSRTTNQIELFDKTFDRIDRFLPRLKEELFKQ